ncbi:MAG: hypothetical protein QXU08_08190 [Ignisphaera sp.]
MTQKRFVVLGPFTGFDKDEESITFIVSGEALVPSNHLRIRYKDLYKIYETPDGLLYPVCEVDESQINRYKPYLAKIPSNASEISEIRKTRCPECGYWRVFDDDPDEMYCPNCNNIVERHTAPIWRSKTIPPNVNIIEGEGIYFLKNTCIFTPHIIKTLSTSIEKLGNLEAECIEFIGYNWSEEFDPHPASGFAIYREYRVKDIDKVFYRIVRMLSTDEMINLLNEVKNPVTKLCLAREISKEKAKEVVIRDELYKHLSWYMYRDLDDDGKLRELVKKYYIEKASSETDPAKRFRIIYDAYIELDKSDEDLKKLAINYGIEAITSMETSDKVEIAYILKDLGYEDENVRNVIKSYEESIEMKRKREEEIVQNIKKHFKNLPVDVYVYSGKAFVKLNGYVKKKDFNMFIETCKKLGFRFDNAKKRWWKIIEDEETKRRAIQVS